MLVALGLPAAASLAQDLEHDLAPPERTFWRRAGSSVGVTVDLIVGGAAQISSAMVVHQPALFRRSASGREWSCVRSLFTTPGGLGANSLAIEGEHLLVLRRIGTLSAFELHPVRLDPVADDWTPMPVASLPPPSGTDVATFGVFMSGERAMVTENRNGLDEVSFIHVYEDRRSPPRAQPRPRRKGGSPSGTQRDRPRMAVERDLARRVLRRMTLPAAADFAVEGSAAATGGAATNYSVTRNDEAGRPSALNSSAASAAPQAYRTATMPPSTASQRIASVSGAMISA